MTEIDVPDWVVDEALAARLPDGSSVRSQIKTPWEMTTMRAAITAALGAWAVSQHQAQWVVEQCWEDITPEQFADLEETEAVTRTLYDLRQEKPE